MNDHFDRLQGAYAITLGKALLAGIGDYRVGAVACVAPDSGSGHAFLEENADALASRDRGQPGLIRVGDPWQFMRRAAGEGLAGIEGTDWKRFPERFRFMFMVRVEDAGVDLPTVLASITEEGLDSCMTRTGVKKLEHAEVLHWERFDVLDPVSGQFAVLCPFRDWDHGDPLYELRTDDLVVVLAHEPLQQDWNSTKGAFAFFTSQEEAEHFHKVHLGNGRNRMVPVGPNPPQDPHEAMASLRPTPVADLRSRLLELVDVSPLAAWCINPDGHRERTAYGRLIFHGDHPVSMQGVATDEVPKMATLSGIWRVLSDNSFERESELAAWTGHDTIRWSGGQSVQLLPLDRSFTLEPSRDSPDTKDLTESDAEEIVGLALQSVKLEESSKMRFESTSASNLLDRFFVRCWDAVTGEGSDFPLDFDGPMDALGHLYAYEREHDSRFRTEGAASCVHIGFEGSGGDSAEELQGDRFRLGLHRIGLRILRSGYVPADAADLVTLCNGTLRTLHVDFAGFAKDLLWASSSDQREELLESLKIDEADWEKWSSSADCHIDPEGRRLVVDRVGVTTWELLGPAARHFLSTALLHLDRQGHAPQLDYAPVSIEIVKALEVELGLVLASFRDEGGKGPFEYDTENHAEHSLAVFLDGGKAPTLGTMSSLLRAPQDDASELKKRLYAYLTGLTNGEFLTSKEFVRKGLHKVINNYRNGGVHDRPIPESVCRKCIEILLGTPDNPGYICQVIRWKHT